MNMKKSLKITYVYILSDAFCKTQHSSSHSDITRAIKSTNTTTKTTTTALVPMALYMESTERRYSDTWTCGTFIYIRICYTRTCTQAYAHIHKFTWIYIYIYMRTHYYTCYVNIYIDWTDSKATCFGFLNFLSDFRYAFLFIIHKSL